MKKIWGAIRNQRGQAIVEYGPLIVFVALVALGALMTFGNKVQALFEGIVLP